MGIEDYKEGLIVEGEGRSLILKTLGGKEIYHLTQSNIDVNSSPCALVAVTVTFIAMSIDEDGA